MSTLIQRSREARRVIASSGVARAFVAALVAAISGAMFAPDVRAAPASRVGRSDGGGASAARDSLPGRIVDVDAGEFFFRAPDSIPAGLTTFRLRQVGMVVERLKAGVTGRAVVADRGDDTRGAHMLWIVRLEEGKSVADLHRAARAGERTASWATQLGGPSFALPPRTSNATLDLAPGNYALVCYTGSARDDRSRAHLLHGMFRALTVLPRTGPRGRPPRPDVTARITSNGTVRFSVPISAGTRVFRVVNETARDFEFKFQRVPAGMTGRAFLASPHGAGPGTPWGGLTSVPPRATVLTTIDFEPGEYVVGTWAAIRHETSQAIMISPRRR